jgi:hypothetical protein
MARVAYVLGSGGGFFPQDFKIGATTVSGATAMRQSTASDPGECVVGGTGQSANFTNMLGLFAESITYTAAPSSGADQAIPRVTGIEGVVRIVTHPFAMLEFRIAGGVTSGLALATTTPANILTNTAADATKLVIAAAEVGTISMVGGLIKGRTGANKGQTRRMTSASSGVSTSVTVAFLNTIGVNDTFIRVPFSKAGVSMQLTTALDEINGIIATATNLGEASVYKVKIGVDDQSTGGDPAKDVVLVYVLMRNHMYNATS